MTEKTSDVIFVGNKPPMSYVLAIITAFSGSQKEITLKARGQAITTAVDCAEITRSRFLKRAQSDKGINWYCRDAAKRRRKQVQNGFHDGDNSQKTIQAKYLHFFVVSSIVFEPLRPEGFHKTGRIESTDLNIIL